MGSKFGIVIWSDKRFVDHAYHKTGSMEPWTLEFTYILNAGTVHERAPFSDFPIFTSLYVFFGISFYKIRIYNLDLV